MATLTVGPSSTYDTIAQAMLHAGPGDSIALESGYSGETATVTQSGMTIIGDASSLGITLRLGGGVGTLTVSGAAPINVLDSVTGTSTEANNITGGTGNNVVTVSGGVDAVNGGLGTDRLVVNYAAAGGAVTGDSTSNFTDASGGRTVTITAGTFEHFTILTGDFADTITTGAGNDIIKVGDGANTVTAGGGANSVTGGSGADTFTALGGGNFMDGGDGANVLTSGDGNDTILSGTGADTIVTAGGIDTITLLGGADTVKAGAQADRLIVDYSAMITAVTGSVTGGSLGAGYTGHIADQVGSTVDFSEVESFVITSGSGADTLTTGAAADTIKGAAGADILNGAAGNDQLYGGTGNDKILGGTGNDSLFGGDGKDGLDGGDGKDRLEGGLGNDAFKFASPVQSGDIITDFHDVAGDNDVFKFSASGFGGGLVAGTTLSASQFEVRADNHAQDANDRFIFRTTDQTLWFDDNGSAAGGLTMVADLQSSAVVTSADILIF